MKESRYNTWVERGDAAYVYNGVSGALLRVPKPDRQSLDRFLLGSDNNCSPKLLVQLANGRMLVPDDADEVAMLGKRYEASRNDTSHFALTMVTSLGCNFDCPYCFEAKHPSIMDDEVQQAILSVVDDQLPQIGSLHVTWFGGEPLVGKKPLIALSDEFIGRCDAAGVEYSADITTNGFLLDEQTCIELKERRVSHAQVCLDGPPEIHDKMRPLAGGKPSFWGIVNNLRHAVEYLPITIRMNVDRENFPHAEALLQILADEGFAGKLSVYAGQIVGVADFAPAPSSSFNHACFTNPDYAKAEMEFNELAHRYGFAQPSLPRPSGAPCTAVRANELVVGSKGELYKCWDSVGNKFEVVGDIRDYKNTNGRLAKWLKYDPFSDPECRACPALPVCMGGCAHHGMDLMQHENRCGTFKHTYREQVLNFVDFAETDPNEGLVTGGALARRMSTR